ncbi:MAG: hypothetical protein PHZ03_10630 [Syntrophomonas sp.]|nr:hypothetical protein [Syntrophomonas sp.]
MEEQLQLIESQLYKSEVTFPPLRERLLRSGELRAWFKYYHGANQWAERYYMEEHVFLMSHVLIVACLFTNGKMTISTFKLEEISRIERSYDFEDKTAKKLILSGATITLKRTRDKKHPDILLFKRPLPEEQGDPEGFEKLMDILD